MANDDQIDVKFGAQTGELAAGAKDAAKAVDGFADAADKAADRITSGWGVIGAVFKGVADGMRQELGERGIDTLTGFGGVSDKVVEGIKQRWSELPPAFRSAAVALGGFAAAGAALWAGKKFSDHMAEDVEATRDFARALGTTTNDASVLKAVLDDVGASQGEFEGAAKGLARQLRENEDRIQALGLKTRDAEGNLRPLTDLVVEGVGVLGEYREGTDRALASQVLFGRGVDASSRLMLLNKDAVEKMKARMRELGIEVGENATAAWAEYDDASDGAALTMKAFGRVIGEAVMPVMTRVIEVFNDVAPAAIVVLRNGLAVLSSAFLGLANGATIAWQTINAMVVSVAEPILSLGSAMKKLVAGDINAATDEMMGVPERIKQTWVSAFEKIADGSRRTFEQITRLWGAGSDVKTGDSGGTEGSKAGPQGDDKPKKAPKEKEPESRFGTWEAALLQRKADIERAGLEEGQMRQLSLADELEYWQTIRGAADLTMKERASVSKKAAEVEMALIKETFDAKLGALQTEAAEWKNNTDEKMRLERQVQSMYQEGTKEFEASRRRMVAIEQQAAQQQQQIERARAESEMAARQQLIDLEEQATNEAFSLGLISRQQLLEQQQQFEQRRFDIAYTGLVMRRGLLLQDPDHNPVEAAQMYAQIEEMARQHQTRMGAMASQLRVETLSPIASIAQGIASAWSNAMGQILTGQMTLKQGIRAVWQGIQQTVSGAISKILQDQITAWMTEKGLKLAKIGANAAEAGSGAAASQASVPFVGPVLALAAMATVFAAVAGMSGKVKSARGGFDIPRGLNPKTQLHEEEMVLPAHLANAVRSMAEGGNAGGGGVVELKAHPMPGNYFMIHRDQLAIAIKALHRDFALR